MASKYLQIIYLSSPSDGSESDAENGRTSLRGEKHDMHADMGKAPPATKISHPHPGHPHPGHPHPAAFKKWTRDELCTLETLLDSHLNTRQIYELTMLPHRTLCAIRCKAKEIGRERREKLRERERKEEEERDMGEKDKYDEEGNGWGEEQEGEVEQEVGGELGDDVLEDQEELADADEMYDADDEKVDGDKEEDGDMSFEMEGKEEIRIVPSEHWMAVNNVPKFAYWWA